MNCFDASALVDYLQGEDEIGEFVASRSTQLFFAPTVALHEVFVGAARLRGTAGVERAREDLDWVEPLPLTVDGAATAAAIDAELRDRGEPIGSMDALIAGTVRDVGGTVVTGDADFERVPDLDVVRYDA